MCHINSVSINDWGCLFTVICRSETILFHSRHVIFLCLSQQNSCLWSIGNTCMIKANDDACAVPQKIAVYNFFVPANLPVYGPSVYCVASNVALHEPWRGEILPSFYACLHSALYIWRRIIFGSDPSQWLGLCPSCFIRYKTDSNVFNSSL